MGFFEEIADKAKNAAQIVGKNAGNLVDTSKLKLHAADLRSDINKNYEALGKLVYESQKNQTDAAGAIGEGVAAIDELYEQLEAVEAQLLKLSNKTICPKCGEKCTSECQFCPKCGEKLEREEEKEKPADCGCGCEAEAEKPADSCGCGSGCGCGSEDEKK